MIKISIDCKCNECEEEYSMNDEDPITCEECIRKEERCQVEEAIKNAWEEIDHLIENWAEEFKKIKQNDEMFLNGYNKGYFEALWEIAEYFDLTNYFDEMVILGNKK